MIKECDYYYNLDNIITRFNLCKESTIKIMNTDKHSFLSRHTLYYKDRYYINIKALLYITYVYRPYNQIFDLFLYLADRVEMFNDIRNIKPLEYLIFNNKETNAYVYIIAKGDEIKIGASINPASRIKGLSTNSKFTNKVEDIKLLYLLKLNSSAEAFKYERNLQYRFKHLKVFNEYFKASIEIDTVITSDYAMILV